jgi:hypothetical protein
VALLVVAVSALIGGAWLVKANLHNHPGSAQHAP